MQRVVWVDSWQIQCCGDPIDVGGTVSWTLSSSFDRPFLRSVIGDHAEGITHAEDHHGDLPEGSPRTEGVVESISAAFCEYAPRRGGPERTLYPVEGTEVLQPREHADGWEVEPDGLRFVGYMVRLSSNE